MDDVGTIASSPLRDAYLGHRLRRKLTDMTDRNILLYLRISVSILTCKDIVKQLRRRKGFQNNRTDRDGSVRNCNFAGFTAWKIRKWRLPHESGF